MLLIRLQRQIPLLAINKICNQFYQLYHIKYLTFALQTHAINIWPNSSANHVSGLGTPWHLVAQQRSVRGWLCIIYLKSTNCSFIVVKLPYLMYFTTTYRCVSWLRESQLGGLQQLKFWYPILYWHDCLSFATKKVTGLSCAFKINFLLTRYSSKMNSYMFVKNITKPHFPANNPLLKHIF